MTRAEPGVWTALDGYRIARLTADDGWVSYQVFRPGQTRSGAVVALLSEARDVVTAWRATNGECGHLHLIRKGA